MKNKSNLPLVPLFGNLNRTRSAIRLLIIALAAVIGLSMTACPAETDPASGGGTGSGGQSAISLTVTNTAEWTAAINTIMAGGNNKFYVITISGNISVPGIDGTNTGLGSLTGISTTLSGSGTLTLSSNGAIFGALSNQTLIIDGPTLVGKSDNTSPLVGIMGGRLELKSGTIRNNGYTAVIVSDNGTFNMSGGTISGNTSTNGAGVVVSNGGTFNMYDGIISGNETTSGGNGGGVDVTNNGTFNMYGGTISGNKAIDNSGNFTKGHAGGVNIHQSTFNMNGGTIAGNNAQYGGGMFIGENSHFNMSGGTISNNTATAYGGGVCTDNFNSFSKTGGTIYGSNADAILQNTAPNGNVFYDRSNNKYRNTTAGPNDNTTTTNFWEN
jgi:hypothetical protein